MKTDSRNSDRSDEVLARDDVSDAGRASVIHFLSKREMLLGVLGDNRVVWIDNVADSGTSYLSDDL